MPPKPTNMLPDSAPAPAAVDDFLNRIAGPPKSGQALPPAPPAAIPSAPLPAQAAPVAAPAVPPSSTTSQSTMSITAVAGTEATKALGVDISEALLLRVQMLAARGKFEKREIRTMRDLVEKALAPFVEELEAKWNAPRIAAA